MQKIFTGVGSRETPPHVLHMMTIIARALAGEGWLLRSGHARGADMAFELGCKAAEIYLPWPGFNGAKVEMGGIYYAPQAGDEMQELFEIASRYHPNWDACSYTAKLFHARNVWQIAGMDLNTPTDMVVCWTKDGKASGGTGQAMRIAEDLKIPIFNLKDPTAIQRMEEFVNGNM